VALYWQGNAKMEEMTTGTIATLMCAIFRSMGHSEITIATEYDRITSICIDIYQHGSTSVNQQSLQEFEIRAEGRLLRGEISAGFHRHLLLTVRRILEFVSTGDLKWKVKKKGSRKYPVTEYYQTCLDGFISVKECRESTVGSIVSACKRHMYWLYKNGILNFKDVVPANIKEYIAMTMNVMRPASARADLAYLRQFYQYLADTNLSTENFKMLLSAKISVKSEIRPTVSRDEVEAIFNSIDLTTATGIRNYAMLMLAAVTGLRGCDIIRLKLTDINWTSGEISVFQSKTSKPVILPLTRNVGEAIKKYVLTIRPVNDSKEVFLRIVSPFQGFASSGALNNIYQQCFKAAGLSKVARTPRSVHSLRRSLGLNMVVAGVPVTTVAQVLGHSSIASTRPYIALDSKHLKECALDFSGIEVRREQIS
jgi:site-specific recombinase XerD